MGQYLALQYGKTGLTDQSIHYTSRNFIAWGLKTLQKTKHWLVYSVLTLRLSLRMVAVNIHGEIEPVVDSLYVISRKLVGFVDAFGVPVCPV